MKIVVYAICKNERPFADRWMASMSEADEVCVLDTGSTDGTPQRLEELGAKVSVQVITPWRFDVARNLRVHRFGRGVPAGLAGKGRGGLGPWCGSSALPLCLELPPRRTGGDGVLV